MIKLTVLYDTPADVEAFDAHYLGTHVPLAQAVPGIEKVEVTRFLPGPDGSAPRFHIMAELYFADADAMGTALATPRARSSARTWRTSAARPPPTWSAPSPDRHPQPTEGLP
jgi:uncharacterized protein (TIGR02118 family)